MIIGKDEKSIADEIGDLSEFKARGNSITEKTMNEFTDRGINVKWFGAKGDGYTDDTAVIQSLLNTLPKFSTLFFPIGIYKVTSQITWDGTISLVGQSRDNTIIKAFEEASTLLLKKDEYTKCGYIKNITLDGSGKVDYVLDFPRGQGLRVVSNYFKNAKKRTVRFGNSVNWGAYEIYFNDNNVIGLEGSADTSNSIPDYAMEISENCTDSSFFNNIVTNSRKAGILSVGSHNNVNDNHVYGYPKEYIMNYCIEITGKTSNYYNNRCDSPLEAGIYVNNWGNRIDSNMIFWNNTFTNLADKTGIKIDNSADTINHISVVKNFIEGAVVSPPQDVTLLGTMPRGSNIKENFGNMVLSFERINFVGKVNVVANTASAKVNFTNAYKSYEYITILTPGWDSGGIRVTRSLIGFTIYWSNNPTSNSEVYFKVEPY